MGGTAGLFCNGALTGLGRKGIRKLLGVWERSSESLRVGEMMVLDEGVDGSVSVLRKDWRLARLGVVSR